MREVALFTPESVLLHMAIYRSYLRRRLGCECFEIVQVEPDVASEILVSQAAIAVLLRENLIEEIQGAGTRSACYGLTAEGWRQGRGIAQ